MSYLVIGGAGYIGSHAVKRLCDEGNEVIVLDSLATGHRQAIDLRARFYEGDLRDSNVLEHIFTQEKVTAVLHFAASSLVGESMQDPLSYYDNNVYGMQCLLKEMSHHQVNQIVFSSTAAVYGEPEISPITEDVIPRPTNPYGETKLAMEKMMRWCNEAYGIQFVALRYFNVGGASKSGVIGEDHSPETHLIPLVLEVALGKRPFITVFGTDYLTPDGTCVRDYIHIEDLVDAHLRALEYVNLGQSGIFNLGSSNGYSVMEIIEAARQVTGHPIPQQNGARRKGDPSRLIASSEKAKQILHWSPIRTRVEDLIADAWHWHQAHPNGYSEVEI